MSNLPVSKYRALDANGDPIAGAKLYTYEGGTTTANPTYSTRAGAILDDGSTNVNANPVVADSNGYFGEIYLTPDEAYKLILKDADDNTLWTDDDVYAVQLSNAENTTRIRQGFASPLDYPEGGVDADGDGSADEYAQVQNAIDASTGVVDLLGKTFRCDSALTLKSGLTIKNGVLDFSNCADNSYLVGYGSLGSTNALTADSARGDLVIDVTDGSGLAAGDWLLIWSTATWDGTYRVGEIVQVDSVAADAVTLKSPVEGTYNTADTAVVQEITPISGVRLENVKIVMSTSASGLGYGLDLSYAEDVELAECRFENAKGVGARLRYSAGVRVRGCVFEKVGTNGAGLLVYNGVRDLTVRDCEFRRMDTGIYLTTGHQPCRHVTIDGNTFDGVGRGLYLRLAHRVKVRDNDFLGDADGTAANATGIHCISVFDLLIEGNDLRDYGGHGIWVNNSVLALTDAVPFAVAIEGNIIRDCDDDGICVTDIGIGSISRNIITGPGEHGISIADSDNVAIIGNTVEGVAGAGDYCLNATVSSGDDLRGVTILGNTMIRDDDSAANMSIAGDCACDVDNVTIIGNALEGGTYGIALSNNETGTTIVADNVFDSMATGDISGSYTGSHSGDATDGRQDRKQLRVTFDATGGKAQGTHSSTVTLPNNAIVTRSFYEVLTTFTSDTDAATIAIGINTNDVAGIVAAKAISHGDNIWDSGVYRDGIQTGEASAAGSNKFSDKTTAERTIDFTVAGGEDLTAGKLILWLEYVVSD